MNNLLSMETQRDQLDFNNFKDRLVDNLIPFKTDAGVTYFVLIIEILLEIPLYFLGITKKHLRIQKLR